jgi:hypothetical protein
MKAKKLNIDKILKSAQMSKWELDNITWADRTTNPASLLDFLKRIKELQGSTDPLELAELKILEELASEMDEAECIELLNLDEEQARQLFIENLARTSAIEIITKERASFDSMSTMCKLPPQDFILTAKRTQDLINSIHELVIQGETLSKDVAGA